MHSGRTHGTVKLPYQSRLGPRVFWPSVSRGILGPGVPDLPYPGSFEPGGGGGGGGGSDLAYQSSLGPGSA